jgi:hypothetical protein
MHPSSLRIQPHDPPAREEGRDRHDLPSGHIPRVLRVRTDGDVALGIVALGTIFFSQYPVGG